MRQKRGYDADPIKTCRRWQQLSVSECLLIIVRPFTAQSCAYGEARERLRGILLLPPRKNALVDQGPSTAMLSNQIIAAESQA